MRLLILAAAVQLANRNAGQIEYGDSTWDKTVAQVIVDEGSLVDVRNPIYASRTALKGEGRFGGECPRFTTTQEFSCSSTPFALNSDFTIEGHFLFENLTRTNQYLVDLGSNGFILRLYNNQIAVHTGGATVILGSSFMPVVNQWYHIAVVRQGALLKLFIDGVMFSQAIYTSNLAYTAYSIGNYGGGGGYSITGRIDQFRVVQSALYTENFIPPSAPFNIGTMEPDFDPYFDKVNLLISNGSAGSMVDSIGGRTITPVNGALVSAVDVKLGNASMDVNAAGSFFQVGGDTSSFNFGSDNWCIEAYVKPTVITTGFTNVVCRINSGAYGGWSLCLNTGRPTLRFSTNGTTWVSLGAPSGGAVIAGRWTHIAACRVGGVVMVFIDGKLVATSSVTGALASGTMPVTIGATNTGTEQFRGVIAAVRVTRGDLRYWSEFTPRINTPYALNGNIVPSNRDPYWPKVQALLEYIDDVGAGPDAFSIVLRRLSVGLDSTRQLFGKDTVTMPTGANGGFNYSNSGKTMLGNVDSTTEGWVNTDYAGSAVMLPIIGQHHASAVGAWVMGVVNGKAAFFIRNGINIESTAIVNDGQWHHVAVVIRSQVVYLYVDGVLQGSGAWGSIPSYNGNVQVGYNIVAEATAGYRLNLSRLRVTQGQARYQANFAPDENTIQLRSLAA